ncbi:uncharacterized protein B0T23DRAFT_205267 [Neurospora hispaniola]|uniref:Uncharacterized protein n=1 Tax=Neurospora hispaniola TaxID=588809 RepID=A0AAJ0I154_9PEZI|nr:hypothetical protein B0T23DRAFT_205267 [Neurospora hispaniola]
MLSSRREEPSTERPGEWNLTGVGGSHTKIGQPWTWTLMSNLIPLPEVKIGIAFEDDLELYLKLNIKMNTAST